MIGSGKLIPDRDAEKIGLPSRKFLSSDGRFVLLIDDLEPKRSKDIQWVFDRYRRALDSVLTENQARRASVHFLVNMSCYDCAYPEKSQGLPIADQVRGLPLRNLGLQHLDSLSELWSTDGHGGGADIPIAASPASLLSTTAAKSRPVRS